jgi:hypothetical protein
MLTYTKVQQYCLWKCFNFNQFPSKVIGGFNHISCVPGATGGATGGAGGPGGPGGLATWPAWPATATISVLYQWFVNGRLRKGIGKTSKGLMCFDELILLLRLTLTNTQACIDRTSVC